MVVAISGSGVSPIVRIPGQSLMLIKRALDTGAQCGTFLLDICINART